MYAFNKFKVFILKSSRLKLFILGVVVISFIYAGNNLFYKKYGKIKTVPLHTRLINDQNYKGMGRSSTLVLTVFYECLCPDSKSFFTKHLLPAVQKAPELITTILIPYGNAKTEIIGPEEFKFSCQHGELECQGNKIHACVIAYVKDMLIQVQLLTCMISDNISPEDIGSKCCKLYNVDWKTIHDCAFGKEAGLLLKQHGDRTHSLVPKVKFIPTVLINDKLGDQPSILKNLWRELCNVLHKMSIETQLTASIHCT